jgi:hypothetical protein
MLSNGIVYYSGKVAVGIPHALEWSKLYTTVPIEPVMSMRLANYRVVFRNKRGLTYAVVSSFHTQSGIARFEPYNVSGGGDAIGAIVHHEEHVAYATARGLTLDDEAICEWNYLGGR